MSTRKAKSLLYREEQEREEVGHISWLGASHSSMLVTAVSSSSRHVRARGRSRDRRVAKEKCGGHSLILQLGPGLSQEPNDVHSDHLSRTAINYFYAMQLHSSGIYASNGIGSLRGEHSGAGFPWHQPSYEHVLPIHDSMQGAAAAEEGPPHATASRLHPTNCNSQFREQAQRNPPRGGSRQDSTAAPRVMHACAPAVTGSAQTAFCSPKPIRGGQYPLPEPEAARFGRKPAAAVQGLQ